MNLLTAESFPLPHILIHRTIHRIERAKNMIP